MGRGARRGGDPDDRRRRGGGVRRRRAGRGIRATTRSTAVSDVYIGGAGMIWALDELGSTGWADAAVSFVDQYRLQARRGRGCRTRRATSSESWGSRSSLPADRRRRPRRPRPRARPRQPRSRHERDDERNTGLAPCRRGDARVDGRREMGGSLGGSRGRGRGGARGGWAVDPAPGEDARYLGVGHGFAGNAWAFANGARSTWTPCSRVSRSATGRSPTGRPPRGSRRTRSACSGATARRASLRRSAT